MIELVRLARIGYIVVTFLSRLPSCSAESNRPGNSQGRPMPNGKHDRKNPLGFAWLVLPAALAAGCQRPVVQRVDPLSLQPGPMLDRAQETNPLPPPALKPDPQLKATTATGTPPAKVAATEPETPPPTPILDSYVQRAEMLKQISLGALDEPESKNQPKPEEDPGPRPKTLMPPAPSRTEEPPAAIELPTTEKPVAESPKPSNEPATINPDRPAEPPRPRDVWGEGLESLRVYAHDREKNSDDSRDLWALRARLLDWMAESQGNDENARLWRTVLTPLAQTPSSASRDEHSRASEIRAAIETLEDELPLEITDLRLCRKVSGFGIYEPLPASACKAGRPVILYCEMSGLRYSALGRLVPVAVGRARRGTVRQGREIGLEASTRDRRGPLPPSPRLFRQLPDHPSRHPAPGPFRAAADSDGPRFRPLRHAFHPVDGPSLKARRAPVLINCANSNPRFSATPAPSSRRAVQRHVPVRLAEEPRPARDPDGVRRRRAVSRRAGSGSCGVSCRPARACGWPCGRCTRRRPGRSSPRSSARPASGG